MQLLKRFGYYLIGLALGSVAVLFFWKNKNVSFDYGMDARTLKSIRIKKRLFSNDVKQILATKKIDTSYISQILKNGDVDFGKSKARQKPCAEYYITGKDSLKNMSLYVTRCDSTSTIDKIFIN
ncbi:hypothetical protein SAMN04487765_3011 [Tenacibaculum sp. MAR_2010_89]|uniref:DUF4258 domain-containing protein n=1 Tax=Tenacibaculum sp. MAR_2010_89 TaxID=1250198 RepID=UPI000895C781|nr:DUF4258 domain-containing protein [Tenacibaculum sp. MAR_2010_89]SEE53910.1 hypothetical protein SAMN04487765_3011 [Tenacibaculum sp. MAR_2010_89]